MYLVDYHIHSKYSFDAATELEDICEAAIERGLSEIAITDHMDIFSNKPYEHILNCKALYEDLCEIKEKYSGRLKVRAGVEYGQPQANPDEAQRFMRDFGQGLDFVIGSVHNMENDIDAYDYDYKKIDYHRVFEMFLDWTKILASDYDYDVLGHITYPSRYIYEQIKVRVDFDQYIDRYTDILKAVIHRGKGIELNMSGYARGTQDAMPDMGLLKLYRRLGGEIITVGSDAHKVGHVGIVTAQGYDILKEAGFEYITVFEKRKPEFVKL
jgi:histidinol-phosphatase (PHP family)